MTQIKRNEWPFVIAFAIIVMTLTSLPYVLGALRSDADWRFSGFVIGVEDGNSYLAKMQQGAHGQWLFQLSYAIEPHSPSLVFLFFIILGKVIGAIVGTADAIRLHDALVFGFHAARVVCGLAMIAVTYCFLAELLPRLKQRRIALVLATIGGGLGWVLIAIPNAGLPLEFYSPETFGFLHLYSLPHLALVRALMLGGLLFYLRALRGRWTWALAAGAAWFVMTLIQPFYMVIVFVLLAIHIALLGALALRQRESELVRGVDLGTTAVRAIWVGAIAGAFGLPLVAYTFFLFLIDPIYQVWGAQNTILSPPAWHYLAAYGLVVAAGLLGLRSLYQRNLTACLLIIGWIMMMPVLLYAPYNLQRRFAEGVFVPLVALAVLGLTIGLGRGRQRQTVKRWGPVLLLALSLPGTLLVWVGGFFAVMQPREPVFQSQDAVATYAFLSRSLPSRSVVLSSYEFGNAVPAYGYLVAFMGHGPETPNLEGKRSTAALFYDSQTLAFDRRTLFDGMSAPYIIIGPHEHQLGDFDPATDTNYLQKVFEAGEYSVWALK